MKLLTFETYQEYYETQKNTVARRGAGPFFTWWEIQRIADYLKQNGVKKFDTKNIICHGARNGREADEFKKHFPDAKCLGTDLFPFSGRSAEYRGECDVIECDFSDVNPDWVGEFDIVYSNSLDHARDPVQTLNVWLDQLKPDGYLFLQWGRGHASDRVGRGDCFGVDFWDFCILLNNVGKLKDILICQIEVDNTNMLQRRGNDVAVFCVQKREKNDD